MVNLVVMARASRNDEALSPAAGPVATRRWLLVAAAVLGPIVLGALITVVLYATRAQPVVARAGPGGGLRRAATRRFVLVIQPRTTGQVRVPLGTSVEVVLLPGVGESIESANADPRAQRRILHAT